MQPVNPATPPEVRPPQSLWAELRDAIRGTNADYTKIPLRRAVFLLAVPMVLELVLESTFAVVDIFFVAKLGPSAVATVGLTESYLFLLYSVAMGLAMAVTAVIARRIGEGKPEEAAVTAVQAIIVALLASLLPAIIGIVYAQDLLRLMGADAWAIEHGYRYTQWMLGGLVGRTPVPRPRPEFHAGGGFRLHRQHRGAGACRRADRGRHPPPRLWPWQNPTMGG